MNDEFVIRLLNKEDDNLYVEFLNSLSKTNPSVLAYHYPFYRDILTNCSIGEPFYVGLYKNTELIAVLPGFIKQTSLGTVYNSMPFFGPNAGVLCLDTKYEEISHKLLIGYIDTKMKEMNSPISMAIYTPFLSNHRNLYLNNFSFTENIERQTQYLYISDTEWDSKIRYDIRKAERAGITVSDTITDEKVDKLYAIYKKNCEDYNIPIKPKSTIIQLAANAKENGNTKFYFAHYQNQIIGALIVLFSINTLSYYLPCSTEDSKTLQPTTFLIVHAFREAKERKINYWNWEASPNKESGVFKFKQKWGSKESSYAVLVKLYCDKEHIKNLGVKTISEAFPYFYVYPFNKL